MSRIFQLSLFIRFLLSMISCSNPTNKRAVTLEELDSIQAQDKIVLETFVPRRDMLTAAEIIDVADCDNLSCIQLYMKNLSRDFVYGKKDEYYAAQRISIKDTAGNWLTLPASTFYVDVNPQATWRVAHTVHTKEQRDNLLNEFKNLDFQLADEGYYIGIKSKQQRYVSKKYPDKNLYVTATFHPFYMKGIYDNKVTWPCYVFEMYKGR
ncbi:MAG TPA: hypothetical protein VK666_05685 [Chryseolinea sp.]|nr:hypothetical protein [Chryseolinea sp.]